MNNYITIDGGTTNTRLRLVRAGDIVSEERFSMGAKDCLSGNIAYKELTKNKIKDLLSKSQMTEKDITAILASGMLTSEAGLYHAPYVEAPAGIGSLHRAMKSANVGISSIPCYFIPGVKISSENTDFCEVMRGEESEFIGLASLMEPSSVCILPGSHTKHIFFDDDKNITSFRTFLTGEMFSAIAQNTILLSSVDMSVSKFDESYLLLGYDKAGELGVNRALFHTRIMDKLFGKNKKELYSYFLGVILRDDVSSLADCKRHIYVGGKHQLRESILYLIRNRLNLSASAIDETYSEFASTRGAIQIFEYGEEK